MRKKYFLRSKKYLKKGLLKKGGGCNSLPLSEASVRGRGREDTRLSWSEASVRVTAYLGGLAPTHSVHPAMERGLWQGGRGGYQSETGLVLSFRSPEVIYAALSATFGDAQKKVRFGGGA